MVKVFIFTYFVVFCQTAWSMPITITPGELGSAELTVRLSIDGVERDFQFDTGADSTIVMPDAQMLRYPSLGKATSGGASGTRVECDLIQPLHLVLDTIEIISPRLRRCDFGDHSLNNVGMDILSGNIVRIESDKSTIDILSEFPMNIAAYSLERIGKGHARMRISLDAKYVGAIFDTGAQLTAVDSLYVAENSSRFKFLADVDNGRDIVGNPVKMKLYEIQGLTIGGFDFVKTAVIAFDFKSLRGYFGKDTPFIIGNNLILQANWILDLKNDQWAVFRGQEN